MAEPKRTDLGLRAEKAVLVQVIANDGRSDHDETFEELESLCRTAGALVVGRLRQKREQPDPHCYVGKGKVRELGRMCGSLKADVVVCDDELSPAQVRALEHALDTKVVDRSEVILDIFATHARTRQAKLQVELAQLEYEFPRLKRLWTHLDRTAGGTLGGPAGGGIGVRGPGERQLEVDRRIVQRRIYDLRKRLKKISRQRHTTASGRNGRFTTVALVGYTNAGKSSLMNALTGADVAVRDRLFETLDTRTRRWRILDGQEVLLSDTVGFVRKFPHDLAASFHATLEEVREADLLLHVVDASKQEGEREINAVNEVLAELDCLDKPTVYLLNKIDQIRDASEAPLLRKLVGEVICTSAVTREGLAEVRERVARHVRAGQTEVKVRAEPGNGRLIAFLYENGDVREKRCEGVDLELTVGISPDCLSAIREMGGHLTSRGSSAS
jgi:GTP-binding protein HflX